ncbi:MAG TPA: HEAT repeat domain-containing protein [Rhodocyclaceae bacterium]|jgi:HEAT repeat protein
MSDVDFSQDLELAPYVDQLSAADATLRLLAVRQISDYADEYPQLFATAARDADAGVRLEAARALEGTVDVHAVEALADLLEDEVVEVATAAAESLAEILDDVVAPTLLKRLIPSRGFARAGLLGALRRLRVEEALAPALDSLDDASAVVRREAVGVLAYLKAAEAVTALGTRAVEDSEVSVRLAATGALVYTVDPAALPFLLRALTDEDWQVREAAAITLGKTALAGSADGLINALQDSSWEVRLKAANALGTLREIRAVPGIIEALLHPVSNLRKEAATALGVIGDVAARSALENALSDCDVEVRKAAQRSLERLP